VQIKENPILPEMIVKALKEKEEKEKKKEKEAKGKSRGK
jgi:hypothetical protein